MTINIIAIFQKQLKDTFKNKTILIQFVMFPILTLVMEQIARMNMPKHFFTNLFSVMYIVMAPLTSMAAIISEEKETNTLRPLFMANVKPWEYLLGIGGYIWLVCMMGACVLGFAGQYSGRALCIFLFIMAVGILASILIGAAIGTWSKNQMTATGLTVPVMLIFSFLPMLSMFNKTIKQIARITYSQQISFLIESVESIKVSMENVLVIVLNMIIAISLFTYAYQKRGFM